MDIKETLEVLEALKTVSVIGAKTFKDGVQISDLKALVELGQNFDVFKAALNNIDLVDDEIKDLDAQEASQLLTKLFDIISAVKAELK